MNKLNKIFDQVYVLNLMGQKDRMSLTERKLKFFDIQYQRVDAVYGTGVQSFYDNLEEGHHFVNSNYLATTISHLNIYSMALDCEYDKILILEDDLRIHRKLEKYLQTYSNPAWDNAMFEDLTDWDLLYLAYIPLSEDLSRWDYSITDEKVEHSYYRVGLGKYRVFSARNLWSLMAYSINSKLMNAVLADYSLSFKMELDRYFVNKVQNNFKWNIFGVSPQLFASENGVSSNSGEDHQDLFRKSVDTRYAELHDYI